MYPVGPRRDQRLQLGIDHLREPFRNIDDSLVDLARMNPGAERQRSRAGRLGRPRRAGPEVLELLDDAQAARRRLDAADRLVARLLVVAPGADLAPHRQRLDPLDDGVVGIDVAVQPAHLAVGDDVDAGGLHVADGRVGGIVEHLLEIAGARLAGLVGPHEREPPAGLAVGADDRRRQDGQAAHSAFPPMTRRTAASRRTSSSVPAKMISPRSMTYNRRVQAGTW